MTDEPLEALGRHVADSSAAQRVSEREHAELKAAILARAQRGREPAAGRPRKPLAWAAGALLVLGVALFALERRPAALRFEVGSGASASPGRLREFVAAPEARALPLRFSDGTRVELAPAARARVMALSREGADLVLEQGRASVHVVPRRGNRWRVSSGPFEIRVTGTRFDVEWQPARDAFRLELREGHVSVFGCGFEGGLAVRAGERVTASCSRHELRVRSIADVNGASEGVARPARAEARVADGEALRPSEPRLDTRSSETQPRKAPPVVPAAPSARFMELARQGRYDEAYTASLELQPSELPNAEAALLYADSARLTRHVARARTAYEALRARFPRTEPAALAAFYLARIELDERGDAASAERWLERYLEEQPEGTLASSALGRLMEALARQGKLNQARNVAARYLALHAEGPHADAARRLLASPSPSR